MSIAAMPNARSGQMFYCHQCSHRWRKSQNSDFFCPQCHQGFIEEVNNNDANIQNDRETTSDPIFSIIHRLISDLPSSPRRSRIQGASSRARSRSRSPRMTFYTVGSNQSGVSDGSLLSRRNAFQFDLDELMNSFLSSPRQPPVSQRRLAELPRVVITEDLTTTQCSICFDEFKLTEADIRKLPCSHLFHEVCIFPWLRQSGTCPVCRACVRPRDQPREEPAVGDVEASNIDSIIRYMRHRRARRRAIEEPATTQAGTQTEQNPPSRIPNLARGMSTRNTTRSGSSSENNASSSRATQRVDTPVSVITGDIPMRLQEQRRRILETRPPIRRPQMNVSADLNDIHRVARSRTFSDLLDNPFGPASHYDPISFDDIVDLTEDLDDLTRDDSSSSSGSSSTSNESGSDSEFTLRSSPPSISGRSSSSLSLDTESEPELPEE